MKIYLPLKQSLQFIAPLLIGLIAFFAITNGGKILIPTYVEWLYEGDSTTHWLGWQYFRYSPMMQWPLGSNLQYGLDIGTSIVFSDSVTIFALFFKALNNILPANFQYSGLWILTCFTLQALFSWKILSLFTRNKWLPLIGSIFFVIAPAAIWRLQYHYALFAHWVILAAIYFYLDKNFKSIRYVALLGLTALIEPYLLAMVLPIWLADTVQKIYLRQLNWTKAFYYSLITVMTLTVIMWAAGYFMLGDSVGASGFGHLRTNLLSFIDPDNMWSKTLQNQNGGTGDYEGFAYLGLGMIFLALIASYELICRNKITYERRLIPLILVGILFLFFALSNNIGFGAHEVLTYDVPLLLRKITSSFRTSGRFIWPVYYMIYIGIFYILFTQIRSSAAIILCTLMLVLQIADTKDAWIFLRNKFDHAPAWISPLSSPAWEEFSKHYNKIIWVNLPRNSKVNWFPICEFAANHRMAINHGYFGRSDPKKIEMAASKLELSINQNDLDPDALYIFEDQALWDIAIRQLSNKNVAGLVDGYKILAPNLQPCNTCKSNGINEIPAVSKNFTPHNKR